MNFEIISALQNEKPASIMGICGFENLVENIKYYQNKPFPVVFGEISEKDVKDWHDKVYGLKPRSTKRYKMDTQEIPIVTEAFEVKL